jgi:acetyl-CoA carboxylase carboxyl transferase subunit beta
MAWFRRKPEETAGTPKKVNIAEGLWIKCDSCKEIMYRAEVERAGRVCPKCRYPFRISARERIALLTDPGTFEEHQTGLTSGDPLRFKDSKRYPDRVKAARQKTGFEDAVVSGIARIDGLPTVLCVFEFAFLGGSMGSVVGEKLTRAIELAIDKALPVIIVCASGGARMQEGILSLMQLPKTVCAVDDLRSARSAFISVMAHPTTAGVLASFASLGDVVIAEPGALLAFTGPRVVQQTTREKLPEDFGLAESNRRFGHVDAIVARSELRPYIGRLLALFGSKPDGA